MGKFIIQPHGRLQEWIADKKGYFRDEGLDYEFRHGLSMASAKRIDATGELAEIRSGAFEAYERAGGNKGTKSDVSCACHWAVNQAASRHIGRMWRKAYVATSGGIMVPPDSPIRRPEDLAGQEIAVGYHSGSHFTTVQSLEPFLAREQIKLKFVGSVWARVDAGLERDVPATSVWGITHQVLEQFGFRKVVDTSFMIAFMFPNDVDERDVEKYMNGLRRAQLDLDLQPEKYKHFYENEVPERYRSKLDVRLFSPGERIVFLPYTDAIYDTTRAWLQDRKLFDEASPTAA